MTDRKSEHLDSNNDAPPKSHVVGVCTSALTLARHPLLGMTAAAAFRVILQCVKVHIDREIIVIIINDVVCLVAY
jgi:hypothetical protein